MRGAAGARQGEGDKDQARGRHDLGEEVWSGDAVTGLNETAGSANMACCHR